MSDGKSIAGKAAGTVVEIAGGVDVSRLGLTSQEGFLLSRVGRGMKLADLVDASGLDEAEAGAILTSLLKKGALREQELPGMAEKVELPDSRKREILELEQKLGKVDPFALLGVPPGAPVEACKNAYYELSMRLHPDRFYGKNLGTFRGRIEKIFRALTEAHQTLTDRDKRAAFEAANPRLFRTATPVDTQVHDKLRAEDRAKRIARHPYLAKVARGHELLARARAAVQAGQFAPAILDLNQLLQLDPAHAEAKKLLAEASVGQDKARVAQNVDEAGKLAMVGNYAAAVKLYLQALDKAPTAELCRQGLAVAKQDGDAKSERIFSQRWVELEPRNVRARLNLAEILERVGMPKNAKREAEEALKLEPDNKTAKALVSKLK